MTVDPVLLAAKTVVALNTIVSREINPVDPSVITVGSIQGGTKAIFIGAHCSGHEALIFVRDTGQGIPELELSRVFDRFWHAQTNNRPGIGLGLSIVKGLVEAHAGRIWVESRLGSESTFFFTLPLAKRPALIDLIQPGQTDLARLPAP